MAMIRRHRQLLFLLCWLLLAALLSVALLSVATASDYEQTPTPLVRDQILD